MYHLLYFKKEAIYFVNRYQIKLFYKLIRNIIENKNEFLFIYHRFIKFHLSFKSR